MERNLGTDSQKLKDLQKEGNNPQLKWSELKKKIKELAKEIDKKEKKTKKKSREKT